MAYVHTAGMSPTPHHHQTSTTPSDDSSIIIVTLSQPALDAMSIQCVKLPPSESIAYGSTSKYSSICVAQPPPRAMLQQQLADGLPDSLAQLVWPGAGDMVERINGVNLLDMTCEAAVAAVRSASTPATVRFRRYTASTISDTYRGKAAAAGLQPTAAGLIGVVQMSRVAIRQARQLRTLEPMKAELASRIEAKQAATASAAASLERLLSSEDQVVSLQAVTARMLARRKQLGKAVKVGRKNAAHAELTKSVMQAAHAHATAELRFLHSTVPAPDTERAAQPSAAVHDQRCAWSAESLQALRAVQDARKVLAQASIQLRNVLAKFPSIAAPVTPPQSPRSASAATRTSSKAPRAEHVRRASVAASTSHAELFSPKSFGVMQSAQHVKMLLSSLREEAVPSMASVLAKLSAAVQRWPQLQTAAGAAALRCCNAYQLPSAQQLLGVDAPTALMSAGALMSPPPGEDASAGTAKHAASDMPWAVLQVSTQLCCVNAAALYALLHRALSVLLAEEEAAHPPHDTDSDSTDTLSQPTSASDHEEHPAAWRSRGMGSEGSRGGEGSAGFAQAGFSDVSNDSDDTEVM